MKNNIIIPGILEKEWQVIEMKIQQVLPFAEAIHIDLIDGKFAENKTFMDPSPFLKYTKEVPFELHMMVEEPINFLKPFSDCGFQRFIGHIEKMSDQTEFVARGQLLGEVGLALDKDTSFDLLEADFEDLDVILFMTIKAGESGQEFIEKNLERVKKAREKTAIPIQVDGGINESTIIKAKNMGADRFVATSFLFNGNPKEKFEILQETLLH